MTSSEYDNLLFKIDARRSEWSEDWKPVAESDVELLAQAAVAVRALQTENTELRRVITEADGVEDNNVRNAYVSYSWIVGKMRAILSSSPLGEDR